MFSRLLRFSLGFFFLPYLALAQQTSTIVGIVSDPTGAVVPEATVLLVNTATDFRRTVITNREGQYTAASIPAGTYRVSVEKSGFQRLERNNITLASAATASVDLTLAVGNNQETVTVSEAASLIQSQSGVVSSLVDSTQMVALPLATRNFTDLVLLTPGAHTGSASNLA